MASSSTSTAAILAAARVQTWHTVQISTGTVRLRALTNAEILDMLADYPEVVRLLASSVEKGEFTMSEIIGVVAPRMVKGLATAIAKAIEGVTADDVPAMAEAIRSMPNDDARALRIGLFTIQAPEGIEAFFGQFLEYLGLDGLVQMVAQAEESSEQAA